MHSHAVVLGFTVALAVGAACSKDADKPASPRDAVIAAWKDAKLAVGALAPADVAFGKDCQTGTVEGIDALVCGFATPADAKAAEDAGLGWVGSVTGASQARGAALVVLADRKKVDPSGRAINRVMKLVPGTP